MRAVGVAEAPGQIGGLGDADSFAADDPRERGAGGADVHLDGAVNQRASVELQPDAQRLGELAGPRGEIARTPDSASGVHEVEAFERLNGRIRTAAPTPSSSRTAFNSEWIP